MKSKANDLGRIGILAGGPSSERQISLRSGKAVYDALIREGLDAILLDVHDNIHDIISRNVMDVAFIALHGKFGEDGSVQKILEDADIPYTGSGVDASRLAMDKIAAKNIFEAESIPTPRYTVFESDSYALDDARVLNWPIVVKPQFEGSSIGLSIAKDESALKSAVSTAFEYGPTILLEEYISGRELTVGILDDEPLPVVEIVPAEGLYDYTAKYSDPRTKYIVPADIEEGSASMAKAIGKRSHSALGCRCFSRVDMIMAGDGKMHVLEVNTIPGMTARSLLPKAADAAGISFGDLCMRLVKDALTRDRIKGRV